MRLKKKVAEKQEEKEGPVITREELLALVQRRLSALQSALGCAVGLVEIHSFCEEEMSNGPHENSAEHLHGGLYEIAELLANCLRRETNGLERELWAVMSNWGVSHETIGDLSLGASQKACAIMDADKQGGVDTLRAQRSLRKASEQLAVALNAVRQVAA